MIIRTTCCNGCQRRVTTARSIFIVLAFAATVAAAPDDFIPYTPTETNPVLEPWRWTSYPELAGIGVQRQFHNPLVDI